MLKAKVNSQVLKVDRLLDIFHQRGKVIDNSTASKSSVPSETKCLTSPSLSMPQKLSRTT